MISDLRKEKEWLFKPDSTNGTPGGYESYSVDVSLSWLTHLCVISLYLSL